MEKVVKFAGILVGALVLGGIMGWIFGLLGFNTIVAALSVAIVDIGISVYNEKKTK